jgi:hypothetical protein
MRGVTHLGGARATILAGLLLCAAGGRRFRLHRPVDAVAGALLGLAGAAAAARLLP